MQVKQHMKKVYSVNNKGWRKIIEALGDNDDALTVMIALEREMDFGYEPTVSSGGVVINLNSSDFDEITVVQ